VTEVMPTASAADTTENRTITLAGSSDPIACIKSHPVKV